MNRREALFFVTSWKSGSSNSYRKERICNANFYVVIHARKPAQREIALRFAITTHSGHATCFVYRLTAGTIIIATWLCLFNKMYLNLCFISQANTKIILNHVKTNQNLAALSQFSFRYVYNHLNTNCQLHFSNMQTPVINHELFHLSNCRCYGIAWPTER